MQLWRNPLPLYFLLLVTSKYFGTLTCVLRIQEAIGDTVVTRQWKDLLALESASVEDGAWEHRRGLVPSGKTVPRRKEGGAAWKNG